MTIVGDLPSIFALFLLSSIVNFLIRFNRPHNKLKWSLLEFIINKSTSKCNCLELNLKCCMSFTLQTSIKARLCLKWLLIYCLGECLFYLIMGRKEIIDRYHLHEVPNNKLFCSIKHKLRPQNQCLEGIQTLALLITNAPRHEKICLRDLRPVNTQTGLFSYWD